MTEREAFDAREQGDRIFRRARYLCEVCGRPLYAGSPQLAHRVPQTKANIRKYGKAAIHDARNLAAVCSLECNSAVLVNGEAERELMEAIKKGQ